MLLFIIHIYFHNISIFQTVGQRKGAPQSWLIEQNREMINN